MATNEEYLKYCKQYGITTKNGLLYMMRRQIGLPEADRIATSCGFGCAEQLVHALEKKKK